MLVDDGLCVRQDELDRWLVKLYKEFRAIEASVAVAAKLGQHVAGAGAEAISRAASPPCARAGRAAEVERKQKEKEAWLREAAA